MKCRECEWISVPFLLVIPLVAWHILRCQSTIVLGMNNIFLRLLEMQVHQTIKTNKRGKKYNFDTHTCCCVCCMSFMASVSNIYCRYSIRVFLFSSNWSDLTITFVFVMPCFVYFIALTQYVFRSPLGRLDCERCQWNHRWLEIRQDSNRRAEVRLVFYFVFVDHWLLTAVSWKSVYLCQ